MLYSFNYETEEEPPSANRRVVVWAKKLCNAHTQPEPASTVAICRQYLKKKKKGHMIFKVPLSWHWVFLDIPVVLSVSYKNVVIVAIAERTVSLSGESPTCCKAVLSCWRKLCCFTSPLHSHSFSSHLDFKATGPSCPFGYNTHTPAPEKSSTQF